MVNKKEMHKLEELTSELNDINNTIQFVESAGKIFINYLEKSVKSYHDDMVISKENALNYLNSRREIILKEIDEVLVLSKNANKKSKKLDDLVK